MALGLAGQAAAEGGEALRRGGRQDALPAVGQDPFDGAVDQLLETAHHLVHAEAASLGLGHGDLLHRVLQLHARGFEPFDQVRPMQELEGRGGVAAQPAFQEAANAVAGMDVVEIGGTDAGRAAILDRDLALGLLGGALVEDGDAGELAGLGIHRLLGHLHRDEARREQHLLGGQKGVLAVFGRQLQAEACAIGAPGEHFEMHLGLGHRLPLRCIS